MRWISIFCSFSYSWILFFPPNVQNKRSVPFWALSGRPPWWRQQQPVRILKQRLRVALALNIKTLKTLGGLQRLETFDDNCSTSPSWHVGYALLVRYILGRQSLLFFSSYTPTESDNFNFSVFVAFFLIPVFQFKGTLGDNGLQIFIK